VELAYAIYDDTHERILAYKFCIQSKSSSTVRDAKNQVFF